jgi:hypothetical protein
LWEDDYLLIAPEESEDATRQSVIESKSTMGFSFPSSAASTLLLVVLALLFVASVDAFTCSPFIISSSNTQQRKPLSYSAGAFNDGDDDEDDDEDDDFIDDASLGDWRTFRRDLASTLGGEEESEESLSATRKTKSVSKENEELLLSQNEQLATEYLTGVWAHETSTVRCITKERSFSQSVTCNFCRHAMQFLFLKVCQLFLFCFFDLYVRVDVLL